jgi:hypothetical protein
MNGLKRIIDFVPQNRFASILFAHQPRNEFAVLPYPRQRHKVGVSIAHHVFRLIFSALPPGRFGALTCRGSNCSNNVGHLKEVGQNDFGQLDAPLVIVKLAVVFESSFG